MSAFNFFTVANLPYQLKFVNPKFYVPLPHCRSNAVCLEPNPLVCGIFNKRRCLLLLLRIRSTHLGPRNSGLVKIVPTSTKGFARIMTMWEMQISTRVLLIHNGNSGVTVHFFRDKRAFKIWKENAIHCNVNLWLLNYL